MQIPFSDDVILDSRRAVILPKQDTVVVSDLFLGLGAARRKRPDMLPEGQHHDMWERLLGLIADYQPKRIALLGDVKPNQGTVEDDEAEELRTFFRKLQGGKREVIQVVGHPERSWGPALEDTGVQPVDSYRIGMHTLMHRRRIFVYPRHDPPQGHWINGGLHPLFAVPTPGPAGQEEYLRYPSFLFTGFALVMPPFVSYAQGWEVMQPERLPRQARAWKVLGDHQMSSLDLTALPPAPEPLRALARTVKRKTEG
ncbi:MAG: hypothetical protein LWX11_04530 [Firmicutes bacterium]|nr:hypothetical protein [Bacillota bacterium]